MKKIFKKTSIYSVIGLFLSISIMPMIGADSNIETEPTIPIEISILQERGILNTETILLTRSELSNILEKFNTIINLLNRESDETVIANILLNLINENENPLLSRLLQYLLNSKISFERKFIISGGWYGLVSTG